MQASNGDSGDCCILDEELDVRGEMVRNLLIESRLCLLFLVLLASDAAAAAAGGCCCCRRKRLRNDIFILDIVSSYFAGKKHVMYFSTTR